MSGSSLTVPPPRDDDHDDVAWALRAASAQWRREATDDAVGWVRRAAETAVEVGEFDRAAELNQLATALAGGPAAVAPPPPAGAVAQADDAVEIDVDVDQVEMLDDVEDIDELDEMDGVEDIDDLDDVEDIDELDEVEGAEDIDDLDDAEEVDDLDEVEEVEDLDGDEIEEVSDDDDIIFDEPESVAPRADGYAASPAPAPLAPAKAPSAPAPSKPQPPAEKRRRPSTSSGMDLPPSMRPRPSGLDLADEEVEDEEFGELHFEEEAPTNRVSLSEQPPAPDIGEVRMDAPSQIPFSHQTAAEFASRHQTADHHDHEELEKELGVDLSVRMPGRAPSAPSQDPSAPAPPRPPEESVNLGDPRASFGQSIPMEDSRGDSFATPPPLEDDPFGAAVSPVPGRTSARPSEPPPDAPRQTSAESEPFGLAPSAELPSAVAKQAPPVIEPPSRPTSAPPPDVMEEPEERPSVLPPVRPSAHPSSVPSPSAVSNAPEPNELDDMFAAISRPPPKPEGAEAVAPAMDAPGIPDLGAGSAASALPLEISDEAIVLDGIDLLEIQGIQDLPDDSAQELARSAQLVTLEKGQEVSSFGVALVTHGAVQLMPTVVDAPCAFARKGEVLFVKGTLQSEVAVRAVAWEPGSRVALFSNEALEKATTTSPWVADELAEVADKYLAFAGAVLGPLGDSLDDTFRFMVLEKCTVKSKAPGTLIATAGQPMDGMYILGGGTLELLGPDGAVQDELGVGDFVFPETVLSAAPASGSVRVGAGGALVLYANRMGAHELLATCPPFIELLAR